MGLLTQRATRTLATYLSGGSFEFLRGGRVARSRSLFYSFLRAKKREQSEGAILFFLLLATFFFDLPSSPSSLFSSTLKNSQQQKEMNLNHYHWLIAYERSNEIPR